MLIGDGGIDFVVANVDFPYVSIVDDEKRGEKGRKKKEGKKKKRKNETKIDGSFMVRFSLFLILLISFCIPTLRYRCLI